MSSRLSRIGRYGRRENKYEDLTGGNHHGTENEKRASAIDALASSFDFDLAATDIEMISTSTSGILPDDTYTVDEAVNKMGFGKFQIKLSLATGFCWMADSMEMMILSILSTALRCSWGINSWQAAFITTVVFLGMMISSTFWGFFSDNYGRKKALILSACILSYYGVLSAFSPDLTWILLLRGLVGFGVGCVPQAVTLYAEFLPVTQRGISIVLLECFWALGACFEVVLALFIMPTYGWRWLLGLSSLPLIVFIIVSIWLPESARFDATTGNVDGAIKTLKRISQDNSKAMPQGRLVIDGVQEVKRGRITDLFIPELRITTLLLWFIWSVCAFCYYGVVLMTTELFRTPRSCSVDNIQSETSCHAGCIQLGTQDYVDLLWTTIAEFPGIFITILIIEFIGRKRTMVAEFLFFSLFVFLLFICSLSRNWLLVVLFGARGIVSGVFQTAYVYTPEVYPTTLRSIGIGACSGMARIGAMVTPIVAQVLLPQSIQITVGIYGVMGILAALATFFLPIETKGRQLQDSHISTVK